MIHYTLNTGHAVDSPLVELTPDISAVLIDLLRKGGGPIPQCAPFRFNVTREPGDAGALFTTIWRAQEPIATCGIAWSNESAQKIWTALNGLHLQMMTKSEHHLDHAPVMPDRIPWLAVVLLPHIANQSRTDLGWLADFERCLAAVLIDASPM